MKIIAKKRLTVVFLMVLTITMAQFVSGCGDNTKTDAPSASDGTQIEEKKVLGEGSRVFPFSVVDKDGNETQYEIHTDKETVGEALLELKLIQGEESQYGLYVKEVSGITADYDSDGTYWAFYINGSYAQTGVDSTAIKEGESYTFKVE